MSDTDEPPSADAAPDAAGPGASEATVVRRDRVEPAAGRGPGASRTWLLLALLGVLAALGSATAAVLVDRSDRIEPASGGEITSEPTTALLSARRVPGWTTELTAKRSLVAALEPVAAAAPPQTCIGVGLGGETVYSLDGTVPLTPASNQKVLTAAAALDILGPDSTLMTDFRAQAAPTDGTLEGNLWMVGGGDPLLTTDARAGTGDNVRPQTDLEAAADQLVALGVRRITGSVIGDETRHDTTRILPGWPERWLERGTVAPLSALLVNDGWLVDPVTGEGPGGPAPDPAAQAAAVMTRLLTDRGVQVGGAPASGAAPEGTESLLGVTSLTVAELTAQLLTFSDNTTGELLLREIGLAVSGEGSTAAGAAAVADWAASKGHPTEGMTVTDGSGLSSGNAVTCELLAAVLRADGPDGAIASGLAIPGQPGTLSDRFGGNEWPARLRAKTGTLNEVTSLSGWLLTRPGATLDFEIVTNTQGRAVGAEDIAFQSQVLTALLDQPVAPPVEQAGPLPPGDA